MVEFDSDITIEVAIMRKLDIMHDVLNGIDARITTISSRITAVEGDLRAACEGVSRKPWKRLPDYDASR